MKDETLWILLVFLFSILAYITFKTVYCEFFGDKYSLDSPCHDPNYRCTVECKAWGKNFTGRIDGFMCDCGDSWVSVCSGFLYPKGEVER